MWVVNWHGNDITEGLMEFKTRGEARDMYERVRFNLMHAGLNRPVQDRCELWDDEGNRAVVDLYTTDI